jgi:uncharacterized CHY-type Zn-finger protein
LHFKTNLVIRKIRGAIIAPFFNEKCKEMKRIIYTVFSLFLLGIFFPSFAIEVRKEFSVPPPPFKEGLYPCSNCHASMEVNRKKRVLKEEHADIKLHHAETMRWCLDCHDSKNRDKLRLYNGELVNFTESYRLCGECHGNLYRDWRAGIHGKRMGSFSGAGKRTYFLCAHCHDPHEPKFKPIKPEPPPLKPMGKKNAR